MKCEYCGLRISQDKKHHFANDLNEFIYYMGTQCAKDFHKKKQVKI